jgi:hypothetical protein
MIWSYISTIWSRYPKWNKSKQIVQISHIALMNIIVLYIFLSTLKSARPGIDCFRKLFRKFSLAGKQSRANHLTALLMQSRLPHVYGLFYRCTGRSTGVPREQLNLISSYIDGNMIYGSDVGRNKVLRTLSQGKMKVWKQEMLPVCQIHCAQKKLE